MRDLMENQNDTRVRNNIYMALIAILLSVFVQLGIVFPHIYTAIISREGSVMPQYSYLPIRPLLVIWFYVLLSALCFLAGSMLFGSEYRQLKPIRKSRLTLATMLFLIVMGSIIVLEITHFVYFFFGHVFVDFCRDVLGKV